MNLLNVNTGRPVYFSYARNSNKKPEWEHISDCMDRLLSEFKNKNIEYRLDKRDIGTGDKISAFENEIGWNSEVVVIVFSDKYFRSMHCMYEFVQIKNALEKYPEKRLMCIKSGDFNLADFNYIRDLERYWHNQKIEYEDIEFHRIREHSKTEIAACKNNFYLEDIRQLYSFFSAINYSNAQNIDYNKFTDDIIKYYINTPIKPKLTPKPADAANPDKMKTSGSNSSSAPAKNRTDVNSKIDINVSPNVVINNNNNSNNNNQSTTTKDNSPKRTAVIIGLLALILGISATMLLKYCNKDTTPESSNQFDQTIKAPKVDTLTVNEEPKVPNADTLNSKGDEEVYDENSNKERISIEIDGFNFTMIFVKGGTFQMGATPEQESNSDEELPVHSVTLNNFYIGQTEVTQGLWKAVMKENPSSFDKGDDYRVEKVCWNDCEEFIIKLNQKTGKAFRFPTEAEWEYAARGGNKSTGCKFSGSNNIDAVAWYKENSNKGTHPVAQKTENELGIYDMSGNVDEWCSDLFEIYSREPQTNPQGPSSSTFQHVYRGSSWNNEDKWAHISYRRANCSSDNGFNTIGLRLALNANNNIREEDNNEQDTTNTNIETIDSTSIKIEANGHAYIDLGLPSGTLWATCNIGASSPEEYGDYFAWGETTAKSEFWWHNYKLCVGENSSWLTKYCSNKYYGYKNFTDSLSILEPCDDAATVNWGGDWCIPSVEQIEEIINNCTWTWSTCNNIKGYEVEGPNGNSIFLPAAGSKGAEKNCGYYFSNQRSTNSRENSKANYLYFKPNVKPKIVNYHRKSGNTIRAVIKSNNF